MKKLLSFLIFGGILLAFNCHNMAFAEGDDHSSIIAPIEITEYQTSQELKNCCESFSAVDPVTFQRTDSIPSPALLPALPFKKELSRSEEYDFVTDSLCGSFRIRLLSCVKRE